MNLETVTDDSHSQHELMENADSKVTIPVTTEQEKTMVLDENEINNNNTLMEMISDLFGHDAVKEPSQSPGRSIEAMSIICDYNVHQIEKLCQTTPTKVLLKTGEESTVHHIKSGRNGNFTVDYQFASKLFQSKLKF